MKRLVVCCDGTWNRPDHLDRGVAAPTNVAKIALALADEDGEAAPQLIHYQAGVGTRAGERLRGGALGIGLSRNVQECYRFVVDNYEPGDTIYLFGFSRGAYTARSTAGLIRNAGVLRPGHEHRIEEAYALYRDPHRDTEPAGIASKLFRRTHSHDDVFIEFVGVWDTVGALGIPLDIPGISSRWTFHDTTLSRYVLHAYHAVAIDERRGPFRPTLWTLKEGDTRPEGTSLEQVWFAGVHCEVGGGYRDPELSEIPLLWMADKARERGLAFKDDHLVVRPQERNDEHRRSGLQLYPDPLWQPLRESRDRLYRLMPAHDRRLRGDNWADVEGGSLAESAKLRYEQDSGYRPPGLDEWLEGGGSVTPLPEAMR
jgi:uncharacterized protein (DUF2235 family)